MASFNLALPGWAKMINEEPWFLTNLLWMLRFILRHSVFTSSYNVTHWLYIPSAGHRSSMLLRGRQPISDRVRLAAGSTWSCPQRRQNKKLRQTFHSSRNKTKDIIFYYRFFDKTPYSYFCHSKMRIAGLQFNSFPQRRPEMQVNGHSRSLRVVSFWVWLTLALRRTVWPQFTFVTHRTTNYARHPVSQKTRRWVGLGWIVAY